MKLSLYHNYLIILLFFTTHFSYGSTWQKANGPEGGNITAIESIDTIVIAGAYPGGLYRSDNTATSWTRCSGTRANWITEIDRMGSLLIVASESGGNYPFTISFSTDSGKTWFENPNAWPFLGIEAMTVHKSRIFIKVQQGGFFRSDDTAKTWIPMESNLPTGKGSFLNVNDFYDDGSILYVCAQAGIMCTKDAGDTWENISGDIPTTSFTLYENNTPEVLSLSVSGDTLFAAKYSEIYRSFNRGKNWTRILRLGTSDVKIKNILCSKSYLMVSCGNEVSISPDRGNTWVQPDSTFPYMQVNRIIIADKGYLAATSGGVFRSSDGTHKWIANNSGMLSQNISAITSMGNSLLAGTLGSGVFESINNSPWEQFSKDSLKYWAMAIANNSSSVFFAFAGDSSEKGGLFKYKDNKMTRLNLTFRPTGMPADYFRAIAASDSMLLVCPAGGLYLSRNDGATFNEIKPDILGNSMVFSLLQNSTSLFLGTSEGFFIYYLSSDSLSAPFKTTFKSLAQNSEKLFGGGIGTLMRSADAGLTWEKTSLTIPPSMPVLNIVCKNDTIYAATDGAGVFRSVDNGTTWNPFNDGLTCMSVTKLYFHKNTLYAGTNGGSIFECSSFVSRNIRQKVVPKFIGRFKVVNKKNAVYLTADQDIHHSFQIKAISLSGKILFVKQYSHFSKGESILLPKSVKNTFIITIGSEVDYQRTIFVF